MHLSLADLVVCIVTPVQLVYDMMNNGKWNADHWTCALAGSIGPISINCSAGMLTAIAWDRHRGIAQTMKVRYSK